MPLEYSSSKNEINGILKKSEGPTFFHSPIWHNILHKSFPKLKPETKIIRLSNENLAVITILFRDFPLGFSYGESTVPGVYGGPIFLNPPLEEHWKVVWEAVNQINDIVIYGNPFLNYVGEPYAEVRTMHTMVLDLSYGFDELKSRFRKGHRYDIRVAKREGVEIRVADTLDDIKAYYNIYQKALDRWGKTASGFYPLRLFRNLFKHPTYGKNIRFWLAKLNGVVIGGTLMFYYHNHVDYWHGVTNSDYYDYHPAHFLVSTALEQACEAGFRWFDFNPSGGLKGVEHFKAGFGAQKMTFPVFRRLTPFGKAFRGYRHLMERTFRTCGLSF